MTARVAFSTVEFASNNSSARASAAKNASRCSSAIVDKAALRCHCAHPDLLVATSGLPACGLTSTRIGCEPVHSALLEETCDNSEELVFQQPFARRTDHAVNICRAPHQIDLWRVARAQPLFELNESDSARMIPVDPGEDLLPCLQRRYDYCG